MTSPDEFDYEAYAFSSGWRDHVDRMGFTFGRCPLDDTRGCFRGQYGPWLTLAIYDEHIELRVALWQRYGPHYKALNVWQVVIAGGVGCINAAAKAARACRDQQQSLGYIAWAFQGR